MKLWVAAYKVVNERIRIFVYKDRKDAREYVEEIRRRYYGKLEFSWWGPRKLMI